MAPRLTLENKIIRILIKIWDPREPINGKSRKKIQ